MIKAKGYHGEKPKKVRTTPSVKENDLVKVLIEVP